MFLVTQKLRKTSYRFRNMSILWWSKEPTCRKLHIGVYIFGVCQYYVCMYIWKPKPKVFSSVKNSYECIMSSMKNEEKYNILKIPTNLKILTSSRESAYNMQYIGAETHIPSISGFRIYTHTAARRENIPVSKELQVLVPRTIVIYAQREREKKKQRHPERAGHFFFFLSPASLQRT